MTLVDNTGLFKSNSFLCQIKPDEDGCYVTLVNREHKNLISKSFCNLESTKNSLSKIFAYLGVDSAIVEDFRKEKDSYCNDSAVLDEFNDIVDMKHNKYEIGSILKLENRYICTYKIYDYKDLNSDEIFLKSSGQLFLGERFNREIFNTLENLEVLNEQKKYIIDYVLPKIEDRLNDKPECENCSKITKDFLINAIEMPDGEYIIDNFDKYTQKDFDDFKSDLKVYRLGTHFENVDNLPEKIEDMKGCITNRPGLLGVYNDRSLFFADECKDKEIATFKFSNKDLKANKTVKPVEVADGVSVVKNDDRSL